MKNLVVLLLLIITSYCKAQLYPFREFVNIDEGGALVNCFFQDEKGLIWVGTHEGLYYYTGNRLVKNHVQGKQSLNNQVIYSYEFLDNQHIYLGTGSGLYLLDIKSNSAVLLPETSSLDIRSIFMSDKQTLLLGTMNGLLKLNIGDSSIEKIQEIPNQPIYSIANVDEDNIFISSDKVFFHYTTTTETYSFISLPFSDESLSLIISMGYDKRNHCLWLGTINNLFKYDLQSKSFSLISALSNNSFKTIRFSSDNNIWLGTDNGLYIYDAITEKLEYYVHSSRNGQSLINNIIWTIFEDREHNFWLGTDCGISLYRNNTTFKTHRWEDITHSDEGNRITCIFKDSRGNYWLGGTNGLAQYNHTRQGAVWYKMRGSTHTVSHNRIRYIHEDKDGDLWVSTDAGVNRFDYTRERFIQYNIMDSTMTRNTNWCYSIFDDENGQLWIGAYMGGMFVVDKQRLMAHTDKIYLAEKNYYFHPSNNGLSSNRIQHAVSDKQGNIWVATSKEGLDKINPDEESIKHFSETQSNNKLTNNNISCLFCDTEGFVWVGMRDALDRIDPETNEIISFRNKLLEGKEILSITEKDNYLWLIVIDGLISFNKQTKQMQYSRIGDQRYTCSFLNPDDQTIWIGGIDQFIIFKPDSILRSSNSQSQIIITSINVNDEPLSAGEKLEGKVTMTHAPAYTQHIKLNYRQNNLAVEFSGASYSQSIQPRYQYRLSNVDKDWRILDDASLRISYSNLQPGNYTLQIQRVNDLEEETFSRRELFITILPPWYASIWAKVFYVILFFGLLLWVINYFRVRTNLRFERIEKEKALELTEMKMDFLTNISHELKTPLSLIINPINKLLSITKNVQAKQLLQTVQQNTMRLSTLVHQIIDLRNTDILHNELFLSKLEIVEFIRTISNMFTETCERKGITLHFHSNVEQLYLQADILKMESIINNLLSNACKFTPEGGAITISLHYDESNARLQLTISDTGVGIPLKDQPYIFERFFQSAATTGINKDGSGIGLSMVKNFVELHHGTVSLSSEEDKGTTIVIILPVAIDKEEKEPLHEEYLQESLPKINVLIVEDNIEIAHFIADNLKNATCTMAHNGKIGLEQAQTIQPDIIISDIMMPVMDGIEMSRLLKQNIATATIPIILLTAKDDKRTESDAYGLGVEAFVSKPFDMNHLIVRMQQIIHNKSLLISKLKQASIIEDKEITAESQDEKFLARITQIIEDKLDDSNLNVNKLSELSGFNSKQIYRRIKLLTGHTAVDYIKSIRLKKAAMLLKQKKFTVAEVMYMVGFSNHSYFSKCFSEKYGKTPRQYMEDSSM